jgi:hypothetical protein
VLRAALTGSANRSGTERRLLADLLALRARVRARGQDGALLVRIGRVLRALGRRVIAIDGHGLPFPKGHIRAVSGPRARVAAQTISQQFSDGSGGTATGSGSLLEPGPGQLGDGINVKVDTVRSVNGVEIGFGNDLELASFADACPDKAGDVTGTTLINYALRVSARGNAKDRAVAFAGGAQVRGDGTFQAHVGADGKIRDYDLQVKVTIVYDGPRPGLFGIGTRIAHERIEQKLSFVHLRVGKVTTNDFVAAFSKATLSGSGFGLYISRADFANYRETVINEIALLYGFSEAALERSQKNFFDEAKCLTAKFDPASLSGVAPGSTNPVGVTVSSVRDGQPVSMPVTLKAAPGDVTPKQARSGSSPIQANLTVSQKPNETTTLGVDGTSNRGRLTGEMTATTTGPLTLVYTPSSTANASYSYDQSSGSFVNKGTYSEQRSLGMTATVPVTSPSQGQSASGSGALTWTGAPSWNTDDLNTSTAQGLAQTCTIDYHTTYSAFTAGVLQVKSLTVGTPGPGGAPNIQLDVIVHGVGEHSHLDETVQSGPCPGFPNDSDTNHFESELNQMHGYLGDSVQPVGKGFEVKINTGWQPGTGNVVATRTVSWSHEGARPGGPADAIHISDTFQLIRSG